MAGGVDGEARPLRARRAAAAPCSLTAPALARSRAAISAVRVLLDALSWITPPPAVLDPVALRQSQQVDQPVEHVGLELGARRARRPDHALHPEPGREQIAQDRGAGGVGREVGVEVGRLPMGEAGEDDLVDVAQHVGEGLALLRRGARQARADRSRLRLGEHGVLLHLFHVTGNPLDDLVSAAAELVRRHVLGFVHGKTFTLTEVCKARSGDDGEHMVADSRCKSACPCHVQVNPATA